MYEISFLHPQKKRLCRPYLFLSLRSNLKKYLDDVSRDADVVIVSRAANEEAVVILSMQEYNALTETGHLLSTEKNRQRLHTSLEQLKQGKTRSFKL